MLRLCFVHAIRHRSSYASLTAVAAICTGTVDSRDAVFARTYYARLIMDNNVPEMDNNKPETLPYCIWYPNVASEATYRQLAQQYPALRYQIGRACAIAGYTSLYSELSLLPDASIAEEARSSSKGTDIYRSVMDQPLRYRVMDDYTRAILNPPIANVFVNGDTALVSSLVIQKTTTRINLSREPECYFDLKEDENVGLDTNNGPDRKFRAGDASLLYNPVVGDLPHMPDKDHLILMAAWYGQVDRYVRLRRPKMVKFEYAFCLRGAYHSTMFAKWWSEQPEISDLPALAQAVNARFTMMNDLTWLEKPNFVRPYMIWWPTEPDYRTLYALWIKDPGMGQAIGHACICLNFQAIYDMIKPYPTETLVKEAKNREHVNPYFLADLRARRGDGYSKYSDHQHEPCWAPLTAGRSKERSTTLILNASVSADLLEGDHDEELYFGCETAGAELELFICTSDAMRKKAAEYDRQTESYALYADLAEDYMAGLRAKDGKND